MERIEEIKNKISESEKIAHLRFWFNGYFTGRRLQKPCRCHVCGDMYFSAIIQQAREINEDSIEHLKVCWMVNHIARTLRFYDPSPEHPNWFSAYEGGVLVGVMINRRPSLMINGQRTNSGCSTQPSTTCIMRLGIERTAWAE